MSACLDSRTKEPGQLRNLQQRGQRGKLDAYIGGDALEGVVPRLAIYQNLPVESPSLLQPSRQGIEQAGLPTACVQESTATLPWKTIPSDLTRVIRQNLNLRKRLARNNNACIFHWECVGGFGLKATQIVSHTNNSFVLPTSSWSGCICLLFHILEELQRGPLDTKRLPAGLTFSIGR